MDPLLASAGWAVIILLVEFVLWRIFFVKTVHICFLTEPDLPLSRYLTIGAMRVLAIVHATFLVGIIFFLYNLLW